VTTSIVAPLLCGAGTAGFGLLGPALAHRGRPAATAWLLTIASCIAAVASTVALAMLALPLLGQDDTLADEFHWSATVLAKDSPAGRSVAVSAAALLLVLLGRAALVVVQRQRAARAARAHVRRLGSPAGGLVVAEDATLDAFALAGARVIVATTGLLKMLPPGERRAVLEHERSHLVHRHHALVLVASAAAALNPLLWRVPASVGYVAERWADEDAAGATSRPVAAAALARVATAKPTRRPVAAIAAAAGVTRRISALQALPPTAQPVAFVVPVLFVAAAVIATVVTTDHMWDVLRLATAADHHVLVHRHFGRG
jgi:Zn-dependent protease with chaperone function